MGGFAVCAFAEREDNMRSPYRIEITPEKQVNILLTSRKERQLRTYPHIVEPEEAKQFANRLEQALAGGHFTDLECCPSAASLLPGRIDSA